MSIKTPYIRCNLKNARFLIAQKERYQIQNSNKYIERHLSAKQPKLRFNNNLFIKSLLYNLENKKENFFFKSSYINKGNLKLNTIQINKKNSLNDIIKKKRNDNNLSLRKSQSCNSIYDEKISLIDNDIKPNNKFSNAYLEEAVKNQDITTSSEINYNKINENNTNISNILKYSNQNQHNCRFLVIRKFPTLKDRNKSIFNKSEIIHKRMKVSRSVQSTIDTNLNKYKINILKNKLNPKRILSNLSYKKIEYLKFLEKKSLALRANFIVNNIQESRGGKQELRALYNPSNK